MAWPKGVRAVKGQTTFLSLMAIALESGNTLGKEIVPAGSELAPREIGVLLKRLSDADPAEPIDTGEWESCCGV